MRMNVEIAVSWEHDVYRQQRSVAGVSRKHILNKAIKVAAKLPCYADRHAAGIYVTAEARIVEEA